MTERSVKQHSLNLIEVFQLACHLHTGQVDKAGRPYIEHLTRVMLRVQAAGGDLIQQMASLLHDAIEDRKASAEQLLWLGVPAEVVELVVVLTKGKDQSYEVYVEGIKSSPRSFLVKSADLEDNSDPERLALLPQAIAQRLSDKYAKAKLILGME